MAYIGIDPNVGDISFQQFTGDGSTTAFTLAQSVASGEAIIVTIGNVVQEPGASAAYTAYANTLTFSAAPANGDVITVRYFGRAVDQPLSYGMQLFKYVATASQTVFTGADSNGAILAFSGTDVDVYLNGVHLDADDFTPSSGNTITLATGASLNDDLVVRAFRAFSVTDTVSASSGGTFNGAVTFDAGANFGDNDKAVFGAGSDLQIYHSGADSYIVDAGTGDLYIRASNELRVQDGNQSNFLYAVEGGDLRLYHNGSEKFRTTSTGVDVTGSAIMTGTDTFNSAATGSGILLKDSGVTSRQLHIAAPGSVSEAVIGTPNSHHLTFATNNTERMRIDTSGNVGIGTSSISSGVKMQVQSTGGTILSIKDTTSGSGDYSNIWFGDEDAEFAGFLGYNHSTDAMTFGTSATERMRIDSSGNVGIGTSSPSAKLHVAGILNIADSSDVSLLNIGSIGGTTRIQGRSGGGNQPLTFWTNDSERMRIDSIGHIGIGGKTAQTHAQTGFYFVNAGELWIGRGAADTIMRFGYTPTSTQVGSVSVTSSSTSYNTSSDYRLKENVVADWDATTRLKQLNPVRFNFIADADTTVDGFLAHEVQSVVPEAVTGTHNEVDDEGNPVYQGIDQSKLVPLLVKTIQELEARIAALEAN